MLKKTDTTGIALSNRLFPFRLQGVICCPFFYCYSSKYLQVLEEFASILC